MSSVTLEMAGSSTVQPLADAWAALYEETCDTVDVTVRGGGSSAGARQVCDQSLGDDESAVDIGNMSRDWNVPAEASPENFPWFYDCAGSDRDAIQVLVGFDGISVVSLADAESVAYQCLQAAFGETGLTINQLRWIFSSYTEEQLNATGWTNDLLGMSNGDDVRTWMELGGDVCADIPIAIVGADDESGTFEFFAEEVFADFDNGETFAASYMGFEVDDEIVEFLENTTYAIGYIPYAFVLSNADVVETVAIENAATGEFVEPSFFSISSGDYSPFSRPLFMNFLDDESSLSVSRPLLEIGFSFDGEQATIAVGYVPVSAGEAVAGLSRVGAVGGVSQEEVGPCGPDGDISIAGSSTVFPIAELWSAVWTNWCPAIDVTVEGGGSSVGACRVCDQCDTLGIDAEAVDIGNMSRDWRESEASTTNGYEFECAATERSAIQIEVAIDGLSVVTAVQGVAHDCVIALGGLTFDQLRWIYSSASVEELTASGWDVTSVPNLDGNNDSYLWSELSENCAAEEILIAGPDALSGTFDFFGEVLFSADDETFDTDRYFNSVDDEEIVEYLIANEGAIGYFGFAFVAQNDFVDPVAIFDGSSFVFPEALTVESGEYPIARRIFMNVLDDPMSLVDTVPFFGFGLSSAGQFLVEETGFSAIPSDENIIMNARVGTPLGNAFGADYDGPCATNGFTLAGSSTVFPVAQLWAGIFEIVCDIEIEVMGGGSGAGAARVCAVPEAGEPVEIGNMSRDWEADEGVMVGDVERVFQCVAGDTERQAIQAQVATDGLTIATQAGGAAAACIEVLGGLTVDQLRWIYSNLSDEELAAEIDLAAAVPNSDGNSSTTLWSELNSACVEAEIMISGADSESGTFDFFTEVVFLAEGEEFGMNYFNSEDDDDLVFFLAGNPTAISYFGIPSFVLNQDIVSAAPIMNANGMFVAPSAATIEDGSYSPFARPIYMNLLNEEGIISDLEAFLQFGYSDSGDLLTAFDGFVALNDEQAATELGRIAEASVDNQEEDDDDDFLQFLLDLLNAILDFLESLFS